MLDVPEPWWDLNFDSITSYERNLPHWRQDGAVYFVTFRLKDSIPKSVLEAWEHDRRIWLAANGVTDANDPTDRLQRYRAIPIERRRAYERDQARRFFVELDRCHGACVFRSADVSAIVEGALRFHDGTRLRCGDFVIMPNHVHWLLMPLGEHKLEEILHSVKRWSARQINLLLGQSGSLWQKESYDRIVRDAGECERTRSYLEQNPIKAQLKLDEFRYHRADWL